ncbi:MAG: hypothetical protein SPL42_03220 [Bacteroidales bacterium]|nr:hypothetical protein [Bacteroidales bacterium]MDY6347432.1 hypothetical protein [Bacteroidales bacterium]
MYYYKFKVFYDEIEDFERDVDIPANFNFEEFHKFLYGCLGLSGNEFASFSICDQKWNKQKEITLTDTSDEEDLAESPDYDDEDSFSTKSNIPKFVMRDAVLKDFITDPHQNILYEYDFMNPKTFYIEFQKAAKSDDTERFPCCTFSKGELPVKVSPKDMPQPEFDESALTLDEEDDFDDGFDDGYNEEDYSDLNEFSEF